MKTILISTIIILRTFTCEAQQPQEKQPEKWALKLDGAALTTGAYSESMRIPGVKRQLSDSRGLQLGAEYIYKSQKHWQLFQNLALMKYWNKDEKGILGATYLGYRRKFRNIFLEGLAGAGYLKSNFPKGREVQDNNGAFRQEDFSLSGFSPAVAIGAGYQINRRISIYSRYYHQAQIQNKAEPQTVRLHRTLQFGLGWHI